MGSNEYRLNEMKNKHTHLSLFFWHLNTITQKQPLEVFCKKKCSEKFRKFHKKTSVLGLQLY